MYLTLTDYEASLIREALENLIDDCEAEQKWAADDRDIISSNQYKIEAAERVLEKMKG